MSINEIYEEYSRRTAAHEQYINEISAMMEESRKHNEALKAEEAKAFNTISPAEFKRIQSERATEEATIKMCESRLKELKSERLFSENELKDYAQQIYNEIEQNDGAAVKLVKKFMADLEKLGEESTEARAKGNDLLLKLEAKTLPLEVLETAGYSQVHLNSGFYKKLSKAQALYQHVKNQYMLLHCDE